LDASEVGLGGCVVVGDDPSWHCAIGGRARPSELNESLNKRQERSGSHAGIPMWTLRRVS
jgi:hypothetical protein